MDIFHRCGHTVTSQRDGLIHLDHSARLQIVKSFNLTTVSVSLLAALALSLADSRAGAKASGLSFLMAAMPLVDFFASTLTGGFPSARKRLPMLLNGPVFIALDDKPKDAWNPCRSSSPFTSMLPGTKPGKAASEGSATWGAEGTASSQFVFSKAFK
eukprot:CAMPEP_0115601610 /NCGR_PEP_ID=MMETSP0272-20121206/15491_1 /TAXON_ID=71861 /ORGANISM="Scrippsiella trochoidea, Strain CCMP3099" /LENGTH=156 /DNA_ID=CAMNT_0003037087 /DNA_START=13 /DNA_END=480 /DNA_ORIENTATION=+